MNNEKQTQVINKFLTEDAVRKFEGPEYDMDCIMNNVDYDKVGYLPLIVMCSISAAVLIMVGIILIGG